MVERVGNDVGWAELFFTTVYTNAADDPEVEVRVKLTYSSARDGDPYQVFPVPLAPLELLVSSPATAGLISDETVFIGNFALWRMRIFNEYVRMQTDFNARFIPELHDSDLPSRRREAIAEGAAWISRQLHVYGIGQANAEGFGCTRASRVRSTMTSSASRADARRASSITATPGGGCSSAT
jgi:hypothetical protein